MRFQLSGSLIHRKLYLPEVTGLLPSQRAPQTILLFLVFFLLANGSSIAAGLPNFLIILADDLGYGDLGCYGGSIVQTPHLDRFASEGIRFTSGYAAAANCSPARTAMMTGRTPTRAGIHSAIPMYAPMHLKRQEITIATLLRQAGYTTAQIGKWHLNGMFNMPGQPQPPDHGFDYWFSTQNNALPNHRNPYNFVRNGIEVGPVEGYAAQIVTDEAIRWLTELRDQEKPFFLYVCYHEPHEPIATAERFSKLYPSKDPSYSAYHGNITQLDHAFGRLMEALEAEGLAETTLVLFTSDNGPARTSMHPHGSTGPLREYKGSLYEGGIRVPAVVRWPGHTQPNRVSDVPISGVDLLPTLCDITGIPVPDDRAIDGASILPILEGEGSVQRETPLYWHFNQARGEPKVAMRVGDWKILAHLSGPEIRARGHIIPADQMAIKRAELASFELYNLAEDIGETTDLAEDHPEKLQDLLSILGPLYREVRDESPVWPAWMSPRYEANRIEWPEYWLQKRGR